MAKIELGNYEQNTRPRWAGDFTGRDHQIPGGIPLDAAQFPRKGGQTVVLNGAATSGDTSITVDALAEDIPAGTYLDFGSSATAYTTDPAKKGATEVAITALGANAADDADAVTQGSGKRHVKSGTVVGRTYAERDAGTDFGPAASGDDQVYLLIHDVDDAGEEAGYAAYRNGSVVYENYLPGFASLAGAVQTLVRAKYDCQIGQD